jgi:nucleoside-diphosphate-sugar epimerase
LRSFQDQDLKTLAPKLQWVGYLSTVGVYGNHDGAWIDESTSVAPASERSRQRVRAEAEWLSIGEAQKLPVGVFRLSGIYGPGRNALLTAEKGKARRLVKKNQVFNRIHVGDIATALNLAATRKAPGAYNITDNEPAPPQDVVKFSHELMGKTPPPEIDFGSQFLW